MLEVKTEVLEVKTEVKKMKSKIRNNEKTLNDILEVVHSIEQMPKLHEKQLPKAAETSEQLDELVNHETLLVSNNNQLLDPKSSLLKWIVSFVKSNLI